MAVGSLWSCASDGNFSARVGSKVESEKARLSVCVNTLASQSCYCPPGGKHRKQRSGRACGTGGVMPMGSAQPKAISSCPSVPQQRRRYAPVLSAVAQPAPRTPSIHRPTRLCGRGACFGCSPESLLCRWPSRPSAQSWAAAAVWVPSTLSFGCSLLGTSMLRLPCLQLRTDPTTIR